MRALIILVCAFLTGCVSPPPLTALPETDPWHAAALEFAHDWEEHPTLPTLETDLCQRYVRQVRVAHTTEQEFAHQTGFCPMTPAGCSTMGQCPGDRCVTGSLVITGRDVVTILLSPGEDSAGHRITVRHEMAHALSACTTGAFDSGHRDARVWSLVWASREERLAHAVHEDVALDAQHVPLDAEDVALLHCGVPLLPETGHLVRARAQP